MQYKNFKDKKLSALGMGCMRLPQLEDKSVDFETTKQMIAYAMEKGINYYDTAWVYHGGKSETVMGEILSEYPRDSFYIATKFPGFDNSYMARVEEIFEKQLEKLRVEYIDFYLFHNVSERNIDGYLDPQYGVYDYLIKQKQNGRIKHLGFSAHGNMDTLKRFLDAYGKDMEFCQLQINWYDWDYQNAKEKVALMASHGIPVWVMEPVRGGGLASLNKFYMSKLDALRPGATAPNWAFRFIQSIPEVTVTLSGMSNFDQLKENIKTFETLDPTNDEERSTLFDISAAMQSEKVLPCTSCKYCMERCPRELNIPAIISLYNERIYSGKKSSSLPEDNGPADCLGCGACEEVCPQNIKISEMMKEF